MGSLLVDRVLMQLHSGVVQLNSAKQPPTSYIACKCSVFRGLFLSGLAGAY